MLPDSVVSSPIPSLSDRQFVVAKDKLSEEAERLQRELFWYREKLFELVTGHWIEVSNLDHLIPRLPLSPSPMRGA